MDMTMGDVLISLRLQQAGLPMLRSVEHWMTGIEPPTDAYASPNAAKTTLSGYGQLRVASEMADTGLETAEDIAPGAISASSNNTAVASVTVGSGATPAAYAVNVSQLAKAMQQTSALVFANANDDYFAAGSFTVTINGQSHEVQVSGGSLNDLVADINAANVGINAQVVQGSYGYQLRLTSSQTGSAYAFSLSSSGTPFDPWNLHLAQLGMTTNISAQDAIYTVNGGPAQTSASNNGIALATGVSMSLAGAGSTTLTVSQAAATWAGVLQSAQAVVQNYNALRGTINNLTTGSGALVGDTMASNYSAATYNNTQATYSGTTYNQLAQIGLTVSGQNAQMQLNTSTLQAAFNNNASETRQLIIDFIQQLRNTISNHAGWTQSSQLVTAASTLQQNMAFINGQPASSYNQISGSIKQYLLEHSLYANTQPVALPRINIFA